MPRGVLNIRHELSGDKVWLRIHFECVTGFGMLLVKLLTEHVADLIEAEAFDFPEGHTILVTDEEGPPRRCQTGFILAEVIHARVRLFPYDTEHLKVVPDIGVMNAFIRYGGAGLFDVQVAYLETEEAKALHDEYESLVQQAQPGVDAWQETFGQCELEEPHSFNELEVLCEEIVDAFTMEVSP